MKNVNDKAIKRLIIAGGIIICVVLVLLISTRLQKEPVTDVAMPETSVASGEVVVDDSTPAESVESTEKEEVTVPPIEVTESSDNENGADDTGTEQTIQADIPEKPTYTEEQLTNPTQTPDGEKVEPPKKGETPKAPVEDVEVKDKYTSGGLPGFDNVPDGGSNQVVDGESDGDINKQVGTMD